MQQNTRRQFIQTLAAASLTGLAAPVFSQSNPNPLPSPTHAADEAYWVEIKKQFTVPANRIMMNAANLCPSPTVVRERMIEYTNALNRDVSFQYRAVFAGLRKKSLSMLAAFVGAAETELGITRNTSESNGMIAHGLDLKDDFKPHSDWLSLMKSRITILYKLLRPDGFFCCHIDDTEGHYLKVLCDEIFGRDNFLTTFYIQVRYASKTLAEDNDFQKVVEQCFIYAKDKRSANANKKLEEYKVEKFEWKIKEFQEGIDLELGGKKVKLFKPGEYEIVKVEPSIQGLKETWATGSLVRQKGSSGEYLEKYLAPRKQTDGLACLYKVFGIGEDGLGYRYFTGPKKADATKGKFYSGIPLDRVEMLERGEGQKEVPIPNFYDLAGSFGNCRLEGNVDFRGGKKPEELLRLIIEHFSNKGDYVLDSFLGSGTTAAVAHKMGRKWVGIELGEHAFTHCLPRLKGIVNGKDDTGISQEVGWNGGGGFKFYTIATSLLNQDKYGNWIISKEYNPSMLAAAMAKQEGFRYAPDEHVYWKQGKSSEKDYIYTTTQFITVEMLDKIHDEMQPDESLLISCKAFQSDCENRHANITIKKIPQMLLGRCEFGKEDYSLNIVNLPKDEAEENEVNEPKAPYKKAKAKKSTQPNLFDEP